jgi:hypothetical protein
MAEQSTLSTQAVLMLGVALDGLAMIEAEPDISKVREGIVSIKSTLKELLEIANKLSAPPPRLGL